MMAPGAAGGWPGGDDWAAKGRVSWGKVCCAQEGEGAAVQLGDGGCAAGIGDWRDKVVN